jgi:hypothetical protein
LLARLGLTAQPENDWARIEHELNIGVLPVEIEFRSGEPFQVVMTQGKFEAFEKIEDETEIENLASSLGLKSEDLNFSSNLPIQTVSTGIKSLAVPVKSLKVLEKIKVNSSGLSDVYLRHGAIGTPLIFSISSLACAVVFWMPARRRRNSSGLVEPRRASSSVIETRLIKIKQRLVERLHSVLRSSGGDRVADLRGFFFVQNVIADERRRNQNFDRRNARISFRRFHQALRNDGF